MAPGLVPPPPTMLSPGPSTGSGSVEGNQRRRCSEQEPAAVSPVRAVDIYIFVKNSYV